MVARKAVLFLAFHVSVSVYVHAHLSFFSLCCVVAAQGSEKELKIVILKRGLLLLVTWSLVS